MKAVSTFALFLCLAASAPGVFAAGPESVTLTHRGMDQAEAGNYRAAIASYSKAIEADPANAQAWHERAMARLELEQDTQAIADFEQALKLNPKFPGAREWLAITLKNRGEHGRAAQEWLRMLRDEPDGPLGMGVSPQSWADCAEQFALSGDRAKAIELLEEYFDKHASRVTSYAIHETAPMRVLARLYDETGQPEKAQKMRKRARNSKHKVPADEA